MRLNYLIDTIPEQRIISIKNEIHQKESWLISVLEKGDVFDDTHAEMVRDFIRDNKNPARPKSLNELMIQFISSAFSYNRIRKQLRKINREVFNSSNYPIRGDHKNILAFILNDSRFEDDKYWIPSQLQMLVSELDDYGKYKERQVLSEFWLEHIMGILRTAPVRLMELTDGGLEQFYQKIDFVCLNDFSDDIVKKSEKLWSKALEISSGVKNVGPNLSCDFLKESGFTDFVKMDIHMIRSMSEFCNLNNCKSLSDFELFVVSQWLAQKINMTPFKLDKILYIYGVYNS